MNRGEPILRAEALGKRFGGVVAAESIDFALAPAELRCIIGPNGAGKSTMFSLLCGIYRPDTGRIVLKGEDVTALPAFRRVQRGLGLTFQTNRAYHNLSVGENFDIARRKGHALSPEAENRFRQAMVAFGLDTVDTDLPARALPHHQLQWLEILMVLAGGPEIALFDEPTAGLSPDETLQTARVLQRLNELGLAIVVVEHDIAFVRAVAHAVTVLHQGRIFAEGPLVEITAREDVRKIYLGHG